MGGEATSQEDMFAKLESMRAVITEVNTQFKDPVSSLCCATILTTAHSITGKDHLRLRLHFRVLVSLRDRTVGAGAHGLRDRYAQYRCQPTPFPQEMYVFMPSP